MPDEPHPGVKQILMLRRQLRAPEMYELSPEDAREQFARRATKGEPAVEVADVSDRSIPGPDGDLDVRVYTPSDDGPHPVLVYFHGGGYILGSLDTHDDLARALCDESGRVVVSVDYRLAPEHPLPDANLDGYYATAWLAENAPEVGGEPGRLAVAGSSAGGTLTAVVSLLARDRRRGEAGMPMDLPDPPDIERQILCYPATQYGDPVPDREEEYLLGDDDIAYFYEHQLRTPLDGYNKYIYPMSAPDLSDLPSATIVTAGFDPLCREGRAYADRLDDEGVEVTYREFEDMVHGFAGMLAEPGKVSRSWEAVRTMVADLD